MSPLQALIVERIRAHGPITVAEYLDLALYHPEYGYYTSSSRRSGRDGDFYTSVDVGPLFGELVALQLADVWSALRENGAGPFHLVECGAGDGRLARDILDAARQASPEFYRQLHVSLCERSPEAAAAQRATLSQHADRVTVGCFDIPRGVRGAIIANELLDALPVHRAVLQNGVLYEIHVAETDGTLREMLLPPSTARLGQFVARLDSPLPEGVVVEIGLASLDWMSDAAAALERGVLMLFDYGGEARELFCRSHAAGTLMSFRNHLPDAGHWLTSPGERDITSHVNFTAIRGAAARAGLVTLGRTDQTSFVINAGISSILDGESTLTSVRRRLAARTLLMPGGLGSTMKAIAFAKDMEALNLRGFASRSIA